jgi:integrase
MLAVSPCPRTRAVPIRKLRMPDVVPPVHEHQRLHGAPLLLADYLEGWLAGIRCRPTTMADYRQSVRVYVAPRIGHLPLRAVRADDLDALYRELEAVGRRRGPCTTAPHTCAANACAPERHGGLAPKTVRNVHGMLHRALAQASERGHVRHNVAGLANPPSARDARDAAVRHDIWDAALLGRFLSRVHGDALHAPLRLIATTGARRGEVLGLRWREVDLTGARVLLGAQTLTAVSGRLVWQRHGKTAAATRDVALDATTLAVLIEHRARQAAARAGVGPRWHDDEHGPLVFTGPLGAPLRPDSFSRRFRALVAATGCPPLDVHGLRHSYATAALRAGVSPEVLSRRLGHADIGITLGFYAHVRPADDRDAALGVARAIDAAVQAEAAADAAAMDAG